MESKTLDDREAPKTPRDQVVDEGESTILEEGAYLVCGEGEICHAGQQEVMYCKNLLGLAALISID